MLHRSVDKKHWTESMKDTRQSTNLHIQVALLSLPMQKKRISHCSVLTQGEKLCGLTSLTLVITFWERLPNHQLHGYYQ